MKPTESFYPANSGRNGRPVLVFGSDTSAFLATVRSLGRSGIEVHAAGCTPNSPAGRSRYLVRHHAIPHYRGDGQEWVARVAALIAKFDFALLVPTSDSALAHLDRHAQTLGRERIATASSQALDVLCDKSATRDLARRLGIAVADGMLVPPGSEPADVISRLGLPVILKNTRSYQPGAIRQKSPVRIAANAAQLEQFLGGDEPLLAESYIPGFCRGLSVLAHEGVILQAFQHRRIRQEHTTGPSSWRRSEQLDARLFHAVDKMIAHTRYTGVAMFEFRCDDVSQRHALLEVNPRFWGSLHLALAAGADYPALLHAMLTDGHIPPVRHDFARDLENGAMWGEYDAVVTRWREARGVRETAYAAFDVLRFLVRFGSGTRFDSFAMDDIAPFKAERREMIAHIGTRLFGTPSTARQSGALA